MGVFFFFVLEGVRARVCVRAKIWCNAKTRWVVIWKKKFLFLFFNVWVGGGGWMQTRILFGW